MLKGKVAIITGSSAGIGAEIARKFAKEEAAGITLHGRREDALENVKKTLIEGGYAANKIQTVLGDITKQETRQNLVEQTLSKFGRLDILVNNAGFYQSAHMSDSEIDKTMHDLFDGNFHAVCSLTQVALSVLKQFKGNVINISSNLSLKLLDGFVAYAATKAAMDHVTKAAAVEFGPDGVRVNVICPGYIPGTDIHRGVHEDEKLKEQIKESIKAANPLRRHGTVQDIANTAAFLASDNAAHITGVILPVDGGWHLT